MTPDNSDDTLARFGKHAQELKGLISELEMHRVDLDSVVDSSEGNATLRDWALALRDDLEELLNSTKPRLP